MSLRACIRHFTRPAAFTAALTALLVPAVAGPATADAAKRAKRYPVVTSVRPMNPKVGDTIVIRGRNFNRGKNKNTVVFKRDGARAVFVKTTLATAKQISVTVPDTLRPFLPDNTSARFRLRVLAQRFSKKFTTNASSPTVTALPKPVTSNGAGTTVNGGTIVTPGAPATTPAPAKVCTGDEDGDMLIAETVNAGRENERLGENDLGLDACNPDSDGDGVPDGYEYQSARDLNDDEYQEPNQYLPYPGKRPYPNPLFADAGVDYDGDGLPMNAEYRLWDGARPDGGVLNDATDTYRLSYSDGEQYSLSTRENGTGRRTPSQPAASYPKFDEFLAWASGHGYGQVKINKTGYWYQDRSDPSHSYDITDVNLNHLADDAQTNDIDPDGFISDDERDEDADGLTNIDELRGRMTPGYWKACYGSVMELPYPVEYLGTDLTNKDTDNDGILDGADDQDHDDVPNIMELSRYMASGNVDWDAHDGTCVISDTIALTGPDGPDEGDEPDPLEEYHASDYGRVNPFNPCLPLRLSRTCPGGSEFGVKFAPFDGSTDWFALQ